MDENTTITAEKLDESTLKAKYGKLYRISVTVPLDDTLEKDYSYYFKRPSVPAYDRYLKSAAQSITRASKAFLLDCIIDEEIQQLTTDMDEDPGIAITIGNRLTELLGLTSSVNLKML